MLTAIITNETVAEAIRTIQSSPNHIGAYEIRLDCIKDWRPESLSTLLQTTSLPIIFTLRSVNHGGFYKGTEAKRLELLLLAAACQPSYIDIEDNVNNNIITLLHEKYPSVKIIRSYHHYQETPENIDNIFKSLQHPHVDLYKIVTMANNAIDALRMLQFCRAHANVNIHCLGEGFIYTRVLGHILGNTFTYTTLKNNKLSDIPCIDEFNQYRISTLSPSSKVYALLGNPVSSSPGDQWHNQFFAQYNINATYIKIKLEPHEVDTFFRLTREFPFHGFSITMPLKQKLSTALTLTEQNHAINTLAIGDNIRHCNTDGLGAIRAIQKHTSIINKKILIIGAGGSAHGILSALQKYTCETYIINRSHDKATILSQRFNAKVIKSICIKADIIINTIPLCAQQGLIRKHKLNNLIDQNTYLLDIVHTPTTTPLIETAKTNRAKCIYGMEMFTQQAHLQQQFWGNVPPSP